jgi:hypothetical protein
MRYVILDLGLFQDYCRGVRWSEDILKHLLEVIVAANMEYLRCNPHTPSVYRAGVSYCREPRGTEYFQSIPSIMLTGCADCEDLSAWRVAELRFHGEPAKFAIYKREKKSGFLLYHIQVRRADGRIEDPSKALGM